MGDKGQKGDWVCLQVPAPPNLTESRLSLHSEDFKAAVGLELWGLRCLGLQSWAIDIGTCTRKQPVIHRTPCASTQLLTNFKSKTMMRTAMRVCVKVCVCIRIHVYVCMYVCIYIYIYIYMCIYIYICIMYTSRKLGLYKGFRLLSLLHSMMEPAGFLELSLLNDCKEAHDNGTASKSPLRQWKGKGQELATITWSLQPRH